MEPAHHSKGWNPNIATKRYATQQRMVNSFEGFI